MDGRRGFENHTEQKKMCILYSNMFMIGYFLIFFIRFKKKIVYRGYHYFNDVRFMILNKIKVSGQLENIPNNLTYYR